MAVNVKLLKKVRKLIAEEPRRLRMGTWGYRFSKEAVKRSHDLPPCGTVACLAGHIILATKPKKGWPSLFRKGRFRCDDFMNGVADKAARLIGMEADDCPFGEVEWGKHEVLAWIDRQIDAAQKS